MTTTRRGGGLPPHAAVTSAASKTAAFTTLQAMLVCIAELTMKRKLTACALLLLLLTSATAADLPEMTVHRTRRPPRVDGRLNDPAWRRSVPLMLVDNQTGRPPAQKTDVRLVRAADTLYVAFSCADTDITATMTRRDDNLWREEVVEVFLDPTGEGREYLEIEVNPLGAVFDAWIRYDTAIDFESALMFDLKNLNVAVRMDGTLKDRIPDTGWTCEMAIPLRELPARPGRAARINLTRIDRIGGRHVYDAWSPTRKWFHVPEKFGRMKLR